MVSPLKALVYTALEMPACPSSVALVRRAIQDGGKWYRSMRSSKTLKCGSEVKKQILNYSFYFSQYIVLYSTLKPENLTSRSKFLKLNYRLRFFFWTEISYFKKKKILFQGKILKQRNRVILTKSILNLNLRKIIFIMSG